MRVNTVTSITSGDMDMFYRANSRHDAYTFSLVGMSVVASVVAQPIVPDDRIAKAWDERLGHREDEASAPSEAAAQPREPWWRRATRCFA